MSSWHTARRVLALLSLASSVGLFSACGGGGGSSNQPDQAQADPGGATPTSAQPANVRAFGDTWTLDETRKVYTGTDPDVQQVNLTSTNVVDALRPDGSFSLSTTSVPVAVPSASETASAPAASASVASSPASGNVSTGLYNAAGHRLASKGCVYLPAQKVYPDEMSPGQNWDGTFTQRCENEDTIHVRGNVSSDTKTFQVGQAKSYRVLEVHYTMTSAPSDVAAEPNQVTGQCYWSPELHLNLWCSIDYSYAVSTPPKGALMHEEFKVTSYSAGTASSAPAAQPASAYPAFTPAMPQVVARNPDTTAALAHPKLVPVLFANAADRDGKVAFLERLVVSPNWRNLQEYGVGSGSVAATVPIAATTPLPLTDADIRNWIANNVGDSHSNIPLDPTADNFLVLYYPPRSQVQPGTSGPKTCTDGGFGGYHSIAKLNDGKTMVPYAVIPDCRDGAGSSTMIVSHEVLEGVVDPSTRGILQVAGDSSWSLAFDGAEIGDMCEHRDAPGMWSADGDHISLVWSNQAAAAYHDGCVPSQQAGEVAFYAVPVLNDTLQVQMNGAGGRAHGVVIPPNGKLNIPVQLLSDGPTYGDWRVTVRPLVAIGAPSATFTLDKPTGHNGDVLHLTIQMPETPMPDGQVFEIVSSYGGRNSVWTGSVGNIAATTQMVSLAGRAQAAVSSSSIKDGEGSAAIFGHVFSLTPDVSGNLLVADDGVVRFVGGDGMVSTLAGTVKGVHATAIDNQGDGFLLGYSRQSSMDQSVNRSLFMRTPGSNTWQTLFTNVDVLPLTAQRAQSLVIGPDGRPYIVEPSLNQVLRFTGGAWQVWAGRADASPGDSTGSVSTQGAASTAAFNHPMALVFDGDGNAYVSDMGNHKIRKIAGGQVTDFAGTGTYAIAGGDRAQAQFANPTALAFDAQTNALYVIDSGFVRMIGSDGVVSTLAGGDLGYSFTALGADGAGHLYAGTTGGFTGIVKITPGR